MAKRHLLPQPQIGAYIENSLQGGQIAETVVGIGVTSIKAIFHQVFPILLLFS